MRSPVEIGQVLASKYRVERVLGKGGMGIVVAARHVQLGSLVALKFLLPQWSHDPEVAARFVREARAAARLRSEHVARVSDFGVLDTGVAYIVMEFLEGADLDAVLEARGRIPPHEAIAYLLDVCKAMDEAHAAGIVHRDLKPRNLFLTHRHDGTALIKVLDFGISKFADPDDAPAGETTETGNAMGSPAFMAPEQVRSAKHVDGRADIYALGAIAFRLITGLNPFDGESVGEVYASVLYKEAPSIREHAPHVPVELERLVARCLKKDPKARFANVRELMASLRSAAEVTLVGTAWESMPPPAPDPSMDTGVNATSLDGLGPGPSVARTGNSTLGRASVSARRVVGRSNWVFTVPIGAIAIAGALGIALVGGLLVRKPSPPETPAPAAKESGAAAPSLGAPAGVLPSSASPSSVSPSGVSPSGGSATALPSTALPSTALPSTASPVAPAPEMRLGPVIEPAPAAPSASTSASASSSSSAPPSAAPSPTVRDMPAAIFFINELDASGPPKRKQPTGPTPLPSARPAKPDVFATPD
ncbi:protein kinase domain-containing protein [Pendulispora albinea]|uniref:Protein kinase n=1 Tax=Pendulispora albinea TaxID=2741071 RepID=A0ABZ2LVV7_9BACT